MAGGRLHARITAAAGLCTAYCAAYAAVPDDSPVYSLVTARHTYQRDPHYFGCAYDPIWGCPEYAYAIFDQARSLAGPAVKSDLNISSELRNRRFYPYAPVLIVVVNLAEGESRVVALAWADISGQACIPGPELDRLGWHPTGQDIVEKDGGVCANLSALAALPTPWVEPVDVLTSKGFRRKQRRERRR